MRECLALKLRYVILAEAVAVCTVHMYHGAQCILKAVYRLFIYTNRAPMHRCKWPETGRHENESRGAWDRKKEGERERARQREKAIRRERELSDGVEARVKT